jgi:hypothetical protein|tara:strand:- start:28 stop:2022 length:1995 start_codon:yes stop_codon:yes gene_type:complete
MLENNWHKKEEPFLSMSGLGGGSFQQAFLPAPAPKVYVDELFSTFVFDGEDSATAINNGIDLSGEGGLVWIKNRLQTYNHWWFDTERGVTKRLASSQTNGEATESKGVTAFNSNGFTVGGSGGDCGFNCGSSNQDYVYWTFRKAPGFFDVVKYTGNGGTQNISHSLGTTPRMVIIKKYDGSGDWAVAYMQGPSLWTGDAYTGMYLNKTDARGSTTSNGLGVSAVGDSTFTVINSGSNTLEFFPNSSGDNYVAYLFAESASFGTTGSEKISEVGTYTGTGATDPALSVDVGFEPQWLMIKRTDSSGPWMIFDAMRGVVVGGTDKILQAESNQIESNLEYNAIKFTSTGFTLETTQGDLNGNGGSYSYLAIRRSHKPPTAATQVFNTTYGTGFPRHVAGFAPDSVFQLQTDGGSGVYNRVLGAEALRTNNTNGTFGSSWTWDMHMNGSGPNYTGSDVFAWSFKRAAGFFDQVTYTGTGSTLNVTHNLGVTPEFIWVKRHDGNSQWATVHNYDLSKGQKIDTDAAEYSLGFNIYGTPTSTTITPHPGSGMNSSGENYIGFLFASRPGVSKVGSYSGTGNDIDVDCGFSSGARFVLVKRVDSSGNWYCWDTLRGIASGNDTYSLWDTAAAQTTNTDYIDPLNAGFTITSSAPAALNTNGGTYIFLAIA